MGVWDAEQHAALATELEQEVAVAWRAAIAHGTLTEGPKLDPTLMFEDVFKDLPAHLREQRDELLAEIAARE
jgi:2-oxoisovalerate dehydrogenase E1 component alpha subunit